METRQSKRGREYKLPDGRWVPSVTTVLSYGKDFSNWEKKIGGKDAAREYRDLRSEEGNIAHNNAEALLLGNTFPHPDDPYIPAIEKCIQPYMAKGKETKWETEVEVWHDLGFAGRFDALRSYKILNAHPTWSIHDFKTKAAGTIGKWSTPKFIEMASSSYWCQMAAYCACVRQRKGIMVQFAVLELLWPDGAWKSFAKSARDLQPYWKHFKTKLEEWNAQALEDSEKQE